MVNENKATLDLRSPYTVILVTCSLSEGYKMTEQSNEDLGRGEILLMGLMDANISWSVSGNLLPWTGLTLAMSCCSALELSLVYK